MKSLKLISTAALLAICTAAGTASAAQVWVAPAAQKVRPNVQPDASAPTQASLAAAQNEFESFQVVVSGAAKSTPAAAKTRTRSSTCCVKSSGARRSSFR